MIRINDLSFGYTGQPLIFDGLDLAIDTGEHVYIKGPSGSGKTTLLRLIMGLEKPLKGGITHDAKHIAPVFQEDRLIDSMTAEENIRFGSRMDTEDIIRDMQIGHLNDKLIGELSGGEKRRIAIARALAHCGDILILDEPFNGVDADNIDVCTAAVKKYAGDNTVLMVTHHPEQAERLSCKALEIG